ncbi:hypothetical protein [Nocardia pseudovaccinii]|uniref:hypothetical protein n=1 Tax=Nocardia pseudovaccinii TaxID=189540 RepID=UPI000AA941CC|nr:hypothetical protein [Nocardia pseudovaccinii]
MVGCVATANALRTFAPALSFGPDVGIPLPVLASIAAACLTYLGNRLTRRNT